jgi:hypothetical protein
MPGLVTMNEICAHVRRSEATVLKLYWTSGFPMTKIGGSWESSTEDIDEWRRELIKKDVEKRTKPPLKLGRVKRNKW